MMTLIDLFGWIITVLAITGALLVTRQSRKLRMYGFWIWILTNGYYMWLGYNTGNYSMAAMFGGYQVINIVGVLNNRKDT